MSGKCEAETLRAKSQAHRPQLTLICGQLGGWINQLHLVFVARLWPDRLRRSPAGIGDRWSVIGDDLAGDYNGPDDNDHPIAVMTLQNPLAKQAPAKCLIYMAHFIKRTTNKSLCKLMIFLLKKRGKSRVKRVSEMISSDQKYSPGWLFMESIGPLIQSWGFRPLN